MALKFKNGLVCLGLILFVCLAPAQSYVDPYGYVYNPGGDNGLKQTVWQTITTAADLNGRADMLPFYSSYAGWTPWLRPLADPPQGKLRNLAAIPTKPRFTLTGKVWPAAPGQASICLWEDDKLAAMSLGIDDNEAPDVPFWLALDQSRRYGKLNLTWNLIVGRGLANYIKGATNVMGTWDLWNKVHSQGYHLASHSMSHAADPVAGDGWPGWAWEVAESQALLDKYITGQKTKMHACAGATVPAFLFLPPQQGSCQPYRNAIARFANSTRVLNNNEQMINRANMIDYLNINALAAAQGRNFCGPLAKTTARLENCLDPASAYYRGWACIFIHWANQGKTWDTDPMYVAYGKALDFYNQHRDDLWTGFMDDVALYGQERDTATLTSQIDAGQLQITIQLNSQMDPATFDYPLTIKVRLPDSWSVVTAAQSGYAIPTQIVNYQGANYALVKAIPDYGPIVLTP